MLLKLPVAATVTLPPGLNVPEICTACHMLLEESTTRTMGYVGYIARMGETRGAYRVLVGKPEGKRTIGTQDRRWDNIKMDLIG